MGIESSPQSLNVKQLTVAQKVHKIRGRTAVGPSVPGTVFICDEVTYFARFPH
jgi:hypothetical protein